MSPKLKQLYIKLRQLANANFERGAYGPGIAREAREKGVRLIEPVMHEGNTEYLKLSKKLMASENPVLRRIGKKLSNSFGLEGEIPTDQLGKSPININPLTNSPFDSHKLHKGTLKTKKQLDKILELEGNKAEEASIFPHIGETVRLSDFEYDRKRLIEELRKKFPEGFVVKKNDARNSIKSRGTKRPEIYFSGDANIGDISKIKAHDMTDWIVQPDKKLKGLPSFLSKIDKRFFPKGNPSGANEYRVNVVNGRIVPYGTKHRGSPSINMMQTILPFRTPELRRVERYAQEAIDAAHPDARKGHYAFDVGFDTANKPKLIETNPGGKGINGFYFTDPNVPDAIRANIQERLPYFVKARRALWGAAGLGGLAAATSGNKNEEQPAAKMAHIKELIKKAANKQSLLPGINKWLKTQPFNYAEDAYTHGRIPKHVRDAIVSGRAAAEYRPKFQEILEHLRSSGKK
jgi:hypothetical protein